MRNFALPLGVAFKERIHHDCAASVSQELAPQSDQTPAWHFELDAHAPITVVVHVDHFALASSQLFHHHADKFFGDIHRKPLNRFHQLAINSLSHDLGFPDH